MKILVSILCLGLLTPVYAAESYQDLSREYNQVYREFLRNKIEKLPKKATIEIFLKDGTSVKGTFEGFSKYDDGVWIMPLGKRGLFSDEAYDVRQIQDVSIIILRSI
jgi:hypothetical protein